MLTLRFSRTGKKKQAYFRIIAVDQAKDPWGTFIENLGQYNPRTKEAVLKEDQIKMWLSKGAMPSKTVHNLLITKGLITGTKEHASHLSKKHKTRLEEKGKVATADAEAKAAKVAAEAEAKKAEAEAKKAEALATEATQAQAAESAAAAPVEAPAPESPVEPVAADAVEAPESAPTPEAPAEEPKA